MSRRPLIIAVVTTLLVGGTTGSAGAAIAGGRATQAVSTAAAVQRAPMAATLDPAGRLNVIRARADGLILRDQKTPAGRFLGWFPMSGPALVSVAAESDTFVAVEAGLDAAGNVYASRQTNAGSTQWTAWELLDGLLTSIALARNADGRLEMIGTNVDGSVVRRTQIAAGSAGTFGWGPWAQLDGPAMQSVAAEANSDGRITMVAIGKSGAVAGLPFFRTQLAANNTNWSGWTTLSGRGIPDGAHLSSIAVAGANDDRLRAFGTDTAGRLLSLRETFLDGPQWEPNWRVEDNASGAAIAAQGDVNYTIHLFGTDRAGTTSVRFGIVTDLYGIWRPMNQYLPLFDGKAKRENLLVIAAEWPGHTHGPNGRSLTEITQMVNSDRWWTEMSYGHKPDFTVATVGQMVVISPPPASLPLCSPDFFAAISAVVDPIAASRSRDPARYDRVLYYLPHLDCAGVEGRVDAVGGKKAYILSNADRGQDMATILHELGHLEGLEHASARKCHVPGHDDQLVTLSTTCTPVEYGDPYSVMGISDTSGFNGAGFAASQRIFPNDNWLADRMISVSAQGGLFAISPIELTTVEPDRSTVQALRIPDNGTTIWVELRQPVGADTDMVTNPGVYIHQEIGGDRHSYLLDMTPGSNPEQHPGGPLDSDFRDANLAAGRTWVNPLGHRAITVVSANSAEAVISITQS